ncbi:MAG: FAD-dependent oxidoreductase [Alphaproteobacteria bacterium]|nr:FAD-dependent oxidoreductase [Alphaproteobacteria bacterium]
MTEAALPLLFSPLRVGQLTLRNRIVSTAHSTGLSDTNAVGDRLIAYYEARARGGVGLIITGSTSVHPTSTSRLMAALANWDDSVIAPYHRMAGAVHAHGALILAQLNHAGAQSASASGTGRLVAPSAVDNEYAGETPHALEPEEIAGIVAAFAAAAVRARAGGLDGVELHGGHGNLIQQFLSPLTNLRRDAYGGSPKRRLRFALEVARAVRKAVGTDFTVGLRISAEEDHQGGLTVADTQIIVPALVTAGALDYVNVTSGSDSTAWSLPHHYAPMYLPRQHMRHLARGIRAVVKVPVIAVGRIVDPRDAEAILAAGDADLVAMTRALIADRDLPEKARRGDFDGIRYCVGANDGCLGRLFRGLHITCIQDPTSGREHELGEIAMAATSRHVVVVGGGVAGLEAARVAAQRGHRVTLLERLPELGGQLRLARRAPGRAEIGAVADHLIRAVERLGVDIRYGVDAEVETVMTLKPDAVVVAAGSEAGLPELADSEDRLVSARAALDGAFVGDPAMVFDTKGDLVGMTTADWLVEQGRSIAFVTPARTPGARIEPMTWRLLYQRLLDRKVQFYLEHQVAGLTEDGVVIAHAITGQRTLLPGVATVVAAGGGYANDGLYRRLRMAAPSLDLRVIGDAAAPRQIEHAIHEGHMAGRAL